MITLVQGLPIGIMIVPNLQTSLIPSFVVNYVFFSAASQLVGNVGFSIILAVFLKV